MNFIEDTYRNVGEGLPIRAENDSQTNASPKPTPAWVTALHRLQPAQQADGVLSKWLTLSEPLPGPGLVYLFLLGSRADLSLLCSLIPLRATLSSSSLFTLGRKGPSESGQF